MVSRPYVRHSVPIANFTFGPVIWTKSNPQPWNHVKPNENIKLMAVNQKFDKRCFRFILFDFMTILTSVRQLEPGQIVGM